MNRTELETEIEHTFKIASEHEKKMFENENPFLLIPGERSTSRKPLANPFVKCRSVGLLYMINTPHAGYCEFIYIHAYAWASQVELVVKNPPASAVDPRDASLIPGSGRSPGGGNGYLLQYSCLENSMDRGVWQATVHGASESLAQHAYVYVCV